MPQRDPAPPAVWAQSHQLALPRQGDEDATERVAPGVIWVSVAFVAVRALNELIFFLFRKRKGYEAPSLMRDIFSLAAYVTAVAVILKLHFANLSFGALLSGSALLGIILGLALLVPAAPAPRRRRSGPSRPSARRWRARRRRGQTTAG